MKAADNVTPIGIVPLLLVVPFVWLYLEPMSEKRTTPQEPDTRNRISDLPCEPYSALASFSAGSTWGVRSRGATMPYSRITSSHDQLGNRGYRPWLQNQIHTGDELLAGCKHLPATEQPQPAHDEPPYHERVLAYLHESLSLPNSSAEQPAPAPADDKAQYGVYAKPTGTAHDTFRLSLQEQLNAMSGMDPEIFLDGPEEVAPTDPAEIAALWEQLRELEQKLHALTEQEEGGNMDSVLSSPKPPPMPWKSDTAAKSSTVSSGTLSKIGLVFRCNGATAKAKTIIEAV